MTTLLERSRLARYTTPELERIARHRRWMAQEARRTWGAASPQHRAALGSLRAVVEELEAR